MDPPDRHAVAYGILDNLRGAAAASRRLAVPNRDENIAVARHEAADALSRRDLVFTIAVERQPIVARLREQVVEFFQLLIGGERSRVGLLGCIDTGEVLSYSSRAKGMGAYNA